ncbi:MAG TPA: hypothetical protein VFN35_20590, partial [Ktedonobacteraceae bacterium]|nr:hypothetical protein [Ktedonobacteraceae bacterium]
MPSKESNIKNRIISEVQEILDRELQPQEQSRRSAHSRAGVSAGAFLDLQDGFYNGLCQGLGLSPSSFQILQPSPPLIQGSNTGLWTYFNNIPPFSLTQNYISSGGNRYFDDYKGLISALKPTNDIDFEGDVGEKVYDAWIGYVSNLNPIPAPNMLPQLFLNWASIRYPSVAQIGAADLSAMLLDPISSAGLALMPYIDPSNPKPADWTPDYNALVQMLNNAPKISFNFNSSTMNTNVSGSWSQGQNEGFFGLWGSSSSTSTLSTQFASSNVTIEASFDHVLTFAGSPGVWYNSSAMGDAFSHQSGAPWNPKSTINWQNTFDAQNGNMARFMVNLIVVSGMHIQVDSDAQYSSDDQQTIVSNSSAGMWPFYSSSSSSSSSTEVSFDSQAHMTVKIDTLGNVPTVIGGNVLPVDKYLGHATKALRLVQ